MQIVYLSNRPHIFTETWSHVRHFMPWVDRALVVAPPAMHAEFEAQYSADLANPWRAAERGYIDAVILPSETRQELVKALRFTSTKRESRPARKHGNIPL